MSQTALITLLAILLYTGGLFGGGPAGPPARVETSPPPAAAEEVKGVIRANTVAVHEAPQSREVIAHLVRGDEVAILGETSGWYRVKLANGQTGYVTSFAVASGSTSNLPAATGNYEVTAYYVTDRRRPSYPSLAENIDVITTVIPWMWQVTPFGTLVDDFDAADVARALDLAGQNRRKGVGLAHNIRATASGAVTFDSALAEEILANPRSRAQAVESLFQAVSAWNMSGVHIDFEWVLPKDRQNLVLFLEALHDRFAPAGYEVSIAVPAKTQESYINAWTGGYDYAAIARHVDKMMLMTYDEHWRGGEPGPVASIGWVERVIRYALSSGVPPEKIVLGVPAYGYDWPSQGRAVAVTYREAMERASAHGARIQWDDTAKAPYFRYGAGRVVWFENRSSLSHKVELVKKYGLAGISLWRLGQEDPGIWSVIRANLS